MVQATLAPLLRSFLDQLGYVIINASDINKIHLHIFNLPTPSVCALHVNKDGSVPTFQAASPSASPAAVYIHSSGVKGNAREVARAIVGSKLAFNGQAPLAPWVAYIDDAVYEQFAAELKAAAHESGFQTGKDASVRGVVEPLIKNGAKALCQAPLYILEETTQ